MDHPDGNRDVYKKQGSLTGLNILFEVPNFLALCASFIGTGAVLMLVDAIDSGSNILRNVFVVLISRLLCKDLRFRYNYGNGKIEAMAGLLCDLLIMVSLLITVGVSIHDILRPAFPGSLIWAVFCLKIVNLLGDFFFYFKQRKLMRGVSTPVIRSTMRVAVKNMIFDSITTFGLLLMLLFGERAWIPYVSPVLSLGLSGYLILTTVRHIPPAIRTLLDKSADEAVQMEILKSLVSVYDEFSVLSDVRSHVVGEKTVVDLELGFEPQTTYAEMRETADRITRRLSENVKGCSVTLCVSGSEDAGTAEKQQ